METAYVGCNFDEICIMQALLNTICMKISVQNLISIGQVDFEKSWLPVDKNAASEKTGSKVLLRLRILNLSNKFHYT